ncbi:HAD family hydrolase [Plectonema cf. radiosum LEGE 06105]|uniref:HAD family hydrolase n=1 Tax=Plectonema cf. radiosum LEGE 06105 TaxID=945769 RepID=A0A8J7F116_9CYAN|nr:HAD family hydrolase [Plectonema radiosum]MBE9211653.1 HAD family hydrolase [Plectonema cf. radiosum LEGE 06105]
MIRLISDFDGPICDVSERYYQVYLFCLKKNHRQNQQIRILSKDEFWQLKRSRVPEKQIGIISGLESAQAENFAQLRKQCVHTQPYFEYDILAPGAVEALLRVQQAGIDLAVMTMRRVRELEYAVQKFDLYQFFPENRRYCLSNDYVKTRDIDDKPLLMAQALKELPHAEETWMVGDTEADIAAAKKHGVKSIAVECGIRDRVQLEAYHPDIFVKNLTEAVNFLLKGWA